MGFQSSLFIQHTISIPTTGDELRIESRANERAKLEKLVQEEMEGVHKLTVPFFVDVGVGPNWRDLN
jgi:DNA polymerase I-like protein with 3'-5' exonuclease and polymerase domains